MLNQQTRTIYCFSLNFRIFLRIRKAIFSFFNFRENDVMENFKFLTKAIVAIILVYALYSIYSISNIKIKQTEDSRKKKVNKYDEENLVE